MTIRHKTRFALIAAIVVLLVSAYFIQRTFFASPETEGGATTAAEAPKGGPPAGQSRGGGVIPITVYVAAPQRITDGITAIGSLVPNEEVDIAGELQGKVTAIEFAEGSRVEKDQLLVRINDDDLQAQLKQFEFRKKTLGEKVERQRILFAQEAVSQESYDQIVTEYNVLLADIELLQVKISRTQIRAPFSGVVGFRYVSLGSYIQPATKIARLVDYNTLKVEFSIPEKYMGTPLVGKQILFTTESSPTKRTATIYAMDPRVDDKTRTIILRARYNNTSQDLRAGMSCRVTIPTIDVADMLLVPSEGVVPSLEGKSLWKVRNGAPVLEPIETGFRNQTMVEVTQGLAVGDSVIITGLMQMRDGAKIKVTN